MVKREITGTGWLSPNGEFVECPPYDHISKAYEICDELKIPYGITPDETLLDKGWMQIVKTVIVNPGYSFYNKFISETQRPILRKFYEAQHDCISYDGLADLHDMNVISYEEWMKGKEK